MFDWLVDFSAPPFLYWILSFVLFWPGAASDTLSGWVEALSNVNRTLRGCSYPLPCILLVSLLIDCFFASHVRRHFKKVDFYQLLWLNLEQ